MNTLRAILRPEIILVLVVWTVAIVLMQMFKGSNVGGSACYTDPTCGENPNMGYAMWAAWLAGILVIFAVGDVWRRFRN